MGLGRRIITASPRNGPLVLRHELGHSLIPVGEEYEGGVSSSLQSQAYRAHFARAPGEEYCGTNSDRIKNLDHLKWKEYLSDPEHVRVEDAKASVQVYPYAHHPSVKMAS